MANTNDSSNNFAGRDTRPKQPTRLPYWETVLAGHQGDTDFAEKAFKHTDPLVRQGALRALVRANACTEDTLNQANNDEDPAVRITAAEIAHKIPGATPRALLSDPDPRVVEAACFGCGETVWVNKAPIEQLAKIATSHEDALCRESAVAALGVIGDPACLPAILTACKDRVTVRRRAVLALASFEDPAAESELRRALADKDWQVRQAAEDLLDIARNPDQH